MEASIRVLQPAGNEIASAQSVRKPTRAVTLYRLVWQKLSVGDNTRLPA